MIDPSDHNGHDFQDPVTGLSMPCKTCGYRLTLVAQFLGQPIPPCPARNPSAKGFDKTTGKTFDIYDELCHCDMKDLMSTGHKLGCPEKKK